MTRRGAVRQVGSAWVILAAFAALGAPKEAGAVDRLCVFREDGLVGSGRCLAYEDGRPFVYLGDTAWELLHRLNREEADLYLTDRASKGFTVIQAVALAELDGLGVPNRYGHAPLVENDPARPLVLDGPSNDYWDHVDYIVGRAEELGLVIGMLPTWGDKFYKKWGVGPEVFTTENARAYGRFLGERYRDAPIIWILGGDRPCEEERHYAVVRAMAGGLREGDGGGHLMTYHPMGGLSSSAFFHEDDWLDFNMLQSGHGAKDTANHRMIEADYARNPVKPCLDGEPCYEDHPINWNPENGWFGEHDVRQAAYWSVFAGACGVTYGCHDIWQFWEPGRDPISAARTPWREALSLPASSQMRHLRALLESRPYFTRIPDQNPLVGAPEGVRATRDADGAYLFVYTPDGAPFTVRMDAVDGAESRAWWFDPRTGEASEIGLFQTTGPREFTAPTQGAADDWVLVLDSAERGFGRPGA